MYPKFLLRRDAESQVEKGHWGGHPIEEMSKGQSRKENPWPARDFRSLISWRMVWEVEHVLEDWQFSYRFRTGLCSVGQEKLPCFWAEASHDQICFRKSQAGVDQLWGDQRGDNGHGPGESGELWRLELTDMIQGYKGRQKMWQWGWSESPDCDALSPVMERRKETFVGEGHNSWEV